MVTLEEAKQQLAEAQTSLEARQQEAQRQEQELKRQQEQLESQQVLRSQNLQQQAQRKAELEKIGSIKSSIMQEKQQVSIQQAQIEEAKQQISQAEQESQRQQEALKMAQQLANKNVNPTQIRDPLVRSYVQQIYAGDDLTSKVQAEIKNREELAQKIKDLSDKGYGIFKVDEAKGTIEASTNLVREPQPLYTPAYTPEGKPLFTVKPQENLFYGAKRVTPMDIPAFKNALTLMEKSPVTLMARESFQNPSLIRFPFPLIQKTNGETKITYFPTGRQVLGVTQNIPFFRSVAPFVIPETPAQGVTMVMTGEILGGALGSKVVQEGITKLNKVIRDPLLLESDKRGEVNIDFLRRRKKGQVLETESKGSGEEARTIMDIIEDKRIAEEQRIDFIMKLQERLKNLKEQGDTARANLLEKFISKLPQNLVKKAQPQVFEIITPFKKTITPDVNIIKIVEKPKIIPQTKSVVTSVQIISPNIPQTKTIQQQQTQQRRIIATIPKVITTTIPKTQIANKIKTDISTGIRTAITNITIPKVTSPTITKTQTQKRRIIATIPKVITTTIETPEELTKKKLEIKKKSIKLIEESFGKANVPTSFIVEERRRGRFKTVGKARTESEAFYLGTKVARTNLGASIRVKTIEGRIVTPKVLPLDFYKSRREEGVLIQRRGKRLSSFGEVKEIQSSKRRKGGALFI